MSAKRKRSSISNVDENAGANSSDGEDAGKIVSAYDSDQDEHAKVCFCE